MGENTATTYAILLEPGANADTAEIARALAPAFGKTSMDLMLELRERAGILAENLTEEQAGGAASSLQQAGINFFVVKQDDLVEPPPPVEIRDGRFADDGYHFFSPPEERFVPWDRVILLECARVRYEVSKIRTSLEVSMDSDGEGNTIRSLRKGQRKVEEPAWKELVEIICEEPWTRIRIDGSSYRFGKDGLPVHLSRHDNFLARVVVLRTRGERAAAGPGVEALLSGKSDAHLRMNSMRSFENHIRWQLQLLYRKGD